MSKANDALLLAHRLGFVVEDDGRVRAPTGRIRKPLYIHGYDTFLFRVSGDTQPRRVWTARLMAYQKYGDRVLERGMEVRHLDGDPKNNSVTNIAIGTHSENMMDVDPEVLRQKALHAASYRRSLTEDEVEELREFRRQGATYKQLCARFGIAKSTVSYIVNYKTYQ